MHRALFQAQGFGRALGGAEDIGLAGLAQARRRHINGFLEIGAVEGIGLFEQGQPGQAAIFQNSLEGELGTGNEGFGNNVPVTRRLAVGAGCI